MPHHAKRMAVGAAIDASLLRACFGGSEHFVAGTASSKSTRQQILPAVAGDQGGLQASRHVLFPKTQHVAHFLGIGTELQVTEAHVSVQHIAAFNDAALTAVVGVFGTGLPLPLAVHMGHEPYRKAQLFVALADVPLEVVGSGYSRRNNTRTERLTDDATRDANQLWVNLLLCRGARFHPADNQLLGGHQLFGVARWQDFQQALMQAAREAIRYGPLAGDIDADALRVPTGDEFTQCLPLGVEVTPRPGRTVGCTERIAVYRHTLERAIRLAVENEHGGTPRRKGGLRHQAEIHGVFGVFAVQHQPHIEARLGHQLRQQMLEPVRHHLVFRGHAFAGGQHGEAISRSNVAALVGRIRRHCGHARRRLRRLRQGRH